MYQTIDNVLSFLSVRLKALITTTHNIPNYSDKAELKMRLVVQRDSTQHFNDLLATFTKIKGKPISDEFEPDEISTAVVELWFFENPGLSLHVVRSGQNFCCWVYTHEQASKIENIDQLQKLIGHFAELERILTRVIENKECEISIYVFDEITIKGGEVSYGKHQSKTERVAAENA